MTNKEIADHFRELAQLMELQDENPFKIRSYQTAYRNLRAMPAPIAELSDDELRSIKGVGDAIRSKIRELLETGKMSTLEKYREMTPPGIREMLDIKGIGPKKIRAIWKDLGVESTGELLYACNENRLLHLKGFGEKTQQKIADALRFYNYAKGRFLYADLEIPSGTLLEQLRNCPSVERAEWTGGLRRRATILDRIHCILYAKDRSFLAGLDEVRIDNEHRQFVEGVYREQFPFRLTIVTDPESFSGLWVETTGSEDFLEEIGWKEKMQSGEARLEDQLGYYVPPELREKDAPFRNCEDEDFRLIRAEDIKGVVHAHTTASDGIHSLEQMVEGARAGGYEYLAITDHSRSAFYAGGLSIEDLRKQGEQIDRLNADLKDFIVFKGIESDILYDGSLDYPDEVLAALDVVIVSIHSQLNMDEEKATNRLIRAIEHPETDILGHPTGRLLLSRPGYPIDHKRVIDACAAKGVAIEINANPRRLDLDWKWVGKALEKGILLSINPDAHSIEGIEDIHYGLLAARKGGLTADACLNAGSAVDFIDGLKK